MGLFSGTFAVAGAFAGLLAYGLLHLESSQLAGWQTVFLFEGGLTVLLGLITLVALPKDPSTAWILTDQQRQHASRRMERDLAHTDEEEKPITWKDVKDVAKDWRKLLTVVFNILSVLVWFSPSRVPSLLSNVPQASYGIYNIPSPHSGRYEL